MKQFFSELKKRKVMRVAVVYLVAGWLIMQVGEVMFPALRLPEWALSLSAVLLILGFPVALILSWAYELTPDGLKRESTVEESPGAPTDQKTVAVLPFADLSPEKDQEYFSDGLTEELLNVLAQLEGLRVSSRTSSFAFKGGNADLRTVAEKLGVSFVVEGSVRKVGDRLRITGQLIEAATDTPIWSQVYDRELDDVFSIQDDIAQQIAATLKVKLLPDQVPVQGTGNVEAYEYFFRGRSFFNLHGQTNHRKAIEMFERATELDPDFSRAWAGLALSHAYFVFFFDGDDADMAAADKASRKAVELGPDVADGYTARIMIAGAQLNFDEADEAFRKATELEPENFEAYFHYGRYLFKRGDLKGALAMYERAQEIDPYDFQTPILMVSILRRLDEDRARDVARKGIKVAEYYLEQHPDNARAYALASGTLAFIGETEKARHYIETALRLDPVSENILYNAACFYANAGEPETAMDYLERGLQDPDWVENDSDLDPLHDHPRYIALVKKLRAAAQ